MKLYSDDLVTVWLLTELRLIPLEFISFQNMGTRTREAISNIERKKGARMIVNNFGENTAIKADVQ